MLLAFYSFALSLVLIAGAPYWLFRMITSGKYREGLSGRLGRVPGALRASDGRPAIWVHAVSVGEVVAASRLIEELTEHAPEYRVVVSTTTRAGQKLARERFGPDRTFYLPLDFAWIVRRYLQQLKPALLVLVESELWPNLLAECRKSSIPVAVVNARISDRSFPRYLRLRSLWNRILGNVTVAMAQSRQDATRLTEVGVAAERVVVTGNLKFDVRAVQSSAISAALRAHTPEDLRILVCGSTMAGEEEILLQAFRDVRASIPGLMMILAPRHPERFDHVAERIRDSGAACVRRSEWLKQPVDLYPGAVMLLDSIGELASVYSLASVAFVGKSLLEPGGHNPLEPAQFGIPIVSGPHYENFREIVDRLLECDAIRLATVETLSPVFAGLLRNKQEARGVGLRALDVFESQAGATRRSMEILLHLLSRIPSAQEKVDGIPAEGRVPR